MSAVVVNWNGADDLAVCLPSLGRQDHRDLEVLVADNGSTDASESVVRRSNAVWVPLGRNAGLAAAMNEGARRAEGEFLLFLNNDMRFPPGFVSRLLDPQLRDVGIFATDASQFDWEGARVVHSRTTLTRHRGNRDGAGWWAWRGWAFAQDECAHQADAVFGCAANLMVRREMFEALGGWDPRYAVGWEDLDLCWRAWLRGWRTVYVPEAACWHRVGASTATRKGAAARYRGTLGGRLYFAAKCLPVPEILAVWGWALAGGVRDLATGRFQDVRARSVVMVEQIGALARALSERRRMYRGAGDTPARHLRRLAAIN